MLLDFFEQMGEGVEYLMAVGSLIGVLGFVIGLLGWFFLGQFNRHKMIPVMIVSIILLVVCGSTNGFKYFHIRH